MKLLLDIGNSSINWVIQNDKGISPCDRIFYDTDSLMQLIHESFKPQIDIKEVLISSVLSVEKTNEITNWFRSNLNCEVWQAETGSRFRDLINNYSNPEHMGVDRWLNMIAARQEFKHRLCVIDCGTAMTIDMIATNGQHEGGYILPGLKMCQETLNSGTNRIQVESLNTGTIQPANNTQDAIANGAMLNLVSSIERVAQQIDTNDETINIVITGGDALNVMKNLSIKVEHRPLLVFEGMIALYETVK